MKYSIFATCTTLLLAGCTKFVQVPPPNNGIVGQVVYSTDATAAAAVTGIYATMINNSVGGGTEGISILAGLSADEIALYPNSSTLLDEVYANAQQSNNPPGIWDNLYYCLYQANDAIQALNSSSSLTPAVQTQLIGESKFIRAFCLFYLAEFYGDVPLVISPAYQINEGLARMQQAQVYQQIVEDLRNAQSLLSDTYIAADGTAANSRIWPNKSAATALLARTYLYEKNWDSAAMESSAVINDGQYSLNGLDSVFLAISTEAIWELEPVNNGYGTPDAFAFLPSIYFSIVPGVSYPVYLSNNLISAFEPNDLRRIKWVDSVVANGSTYYFPYKYQALLLTSYPPPENVVVLRLAEQYLIRAEAEAYGAGSGIPGALADLDTIRNRAGLPDYSGPTDQNSLLIAILRERRVELFTEYGHRWFDLQRTNTIDSVMGPACAQKGGSWNHDWELYPIPLSEIQADSRLTQNPGYE